MAVVTEMIEVIDILAPMEAVPTAAAEVVTHWIDLIFVHSAVPSIRLHLPAFSFSYSGFTGNLGILYLIIVLDSCLKSWIQSILDFGI